MSAPTDHSLSGQEFLIRPTYQTLSEGTAEEQATFAEIVIKLGDLALSEAEDVLTNTVREGAYLSAARLAEWLAWNWWRLTSEPARPGGRQSAEWRLSHCMRGIGSGYVWPNVTICSDGRQVEIKAEPDRKSPPASLRYLASVRTSIPVQTFETAVDEFLTNVTQRLMERDLAQTHLHQLVDELSEERNDDDLSIYRRIEAWTGFGPGEANEDTIAQVRQTLAQLGEEAVVDLALSEEERSPPLTVDRLLAIADEVGETAGPLNQAVQLDRTRAQSLPQSSTAEAWRRGVAAARELRAQERLGNTPLCDSRLAQMAALSEDVLSSDRFNRGLGFFWTRNAAQTRIVMPSRHRTNRRFAIARLIGDRIASGAQSDFCPIARSFTYRQKLQRAFAGEFLCPYDSLKEQLGGDFSEEAQQDAADRFAVSPFVVGTMLVNHGDVDREAGGQWGNIDRM